MSYIINSIPEEIEVFLILSVKQENKGKNGISDSITGPRTTVEYYMKD